MASASLRRSVTVRPPAALFVSVCGPRRRSPNRRGCDPRFLTTVVAAPGPPARPSADRAIETRRFHRGSRRENASHRRNPNRTLAAHDPLPGRLAALGGRRFRRGPPSPTVNASWPAWRMSSVIAAGMFSSSFTLIASTPCAAAAGPLRVPARPHTPGRPEYPRPQEPDTAAGFLRTSRPPSGNRGRSTP